MQKTTIIFDFDGTIGNSLPYIYKIVNSLARTYKFPAVSEKQFEELRGKSPLEIIKTLNIPVLKIPFALNRGRKLMNKYMKDVPYYPGMRQLLFGLKDAGKTLGLLSSNSRENIDLFLKTHSLNVFDFVYTENNLFGKQFSLSHILKTEKIVKDQAVYVGDEVRDIDACQVLGLDIISVTWGFSTKEVLAERSPTWLVETPSALGQLLHSPSE